MVRVSMQEETFKAPAGLQLNACCLQTQHGSPVLFQQDLCDFSWEVRGAVGCVTTHGGGTSC